MAQVSAQGLIFAEINIRGEIADWIFGPFYLRTGFLALFISGLGFWPFLFADSFFGPFYLRTGFLVLFIYGGAAY